MTVPTTAGFVHVLTLVIVLALGGCTSEYENVQVDGGSASPESARAAAEENRSVDGAGVDASGGADTDAAGGSSANGRAGSDTGALPDQLLPVDEAPSDPALLAFRMRMLEAVGARDAEFLLAHVADDIRVSFGAGGGKQAFREMWNPSDPQSEIWMILGRILGGGGLYEATSFQLSDGRTAEARFSAPYYYAAYPGERFDPFQHGVVIVPDAVVRDSPNADAPAIDTLSFQIVRTPEFVPGSQEDWVDVELGDGRTGYVDASEIRSPIGYRAIFHRVGDDWTLSTLVAGD